MCIRDRYTVHTASTLSENGAPVNVFFLVDDTMLKKYMFEYKESRPSVGIVVIDLSLIHIYAPRPDLLIPLRKE